METDFKEPTLQLINLKSPELLREYLVDKKNLNLYKKYIEKGILKHNEEDFAQMNNGIAAKLESLKKQKEEDSENEPFVLEITKKTCEFYAQIFDIANFEKLASELIEKDGCNALKMDILMCKIRIAIILEDRHSLVRSIEDAQALFDTSSDWDRKNRLKVYFGLFHLIKAEFKTAAGYFSESLASFDAKELISFDKLILYLLFSSLITFDRNELKSKIVDNPEVRKCPELLKLPESMFNCDYPHLFRLLLEFIDLCEEDVFLENFKEYFCKEMKIRAYAQLLLCYQSLNLDKMAQCFNVEASFVEEDLRNFIVEQRINCVIDRIDNVVRMKVDKKDCDLQRLIKTGESVLRDIKKTINQ